MDRRQIAGVTFGLLFLVSSGVTRYAIAQQPAGVKWSSISNHPLPVTGAARGATAVATPPSVPPTPTPFPVAGPAQPPGQQQPGNPPAGATPASPPPTVSPSPIPSPVSGPAQPQPIPSPTPTPPAVPAPIPSPISVRSPPASGGRPFPLDIPDGWIEISSYKGVWVLEKSQPISGLSEKALYYLVLADLHDARVRSLSSDSERGFVECKEIWVFWNAGLNSNTPDSKLKAIVSGTFFDVDPAALLAFRPYPVWATGISFGLKRSGKTVDTGTRMSGITEKFPQPGDVRVLVWNDDEARIIPYATAAFTDVRWPQVVGGLDPVHPVMPNQYMGRSVVGTCDLDRNGQSEFLMFLVSNCANQEQATKGIMRFGCGEIMLLDGSNTAQIVIDGIERVKHPDRPFPHAFAIYGGR